MARKVVSFRLDGELDGRLSVVAAARGCSRTDLVEAGLLLVLADPPASRAAGMVADSAAAQRHDRALPRVGHLPTCRCGLCQASGK